MMGLTINSFWQGGLTGPIYSGGIFVSGTISFNPSDLVNINLTNINLTATVASAAAGGVRGTGSHSTGLFYSEYTLPGTVSSALTIGFASSGWTENQASGLGGLGNSSVGYTPGFAGNVFLNNVSIGTAAPGGANAVIGIAINFTASLIWVRVNGGNWNNAVIGSQNPAGNVGGFSFSTITTGPYFPAFGGTSTSDAVTANFGASAYQTASPSGYGNW